MAKPSKQKSYAYKMFIKERKRQAALKLREEERYNSLCGPVTVTKIKAN
jgi:hypothetical protein